jgi:hypothetical protein
MNYKGFGRKRYWHQEFSLLYIIQTGSGARPMGTRDSFSGHKAVSKVLAFSPLTLTVLLFV